MSSSSRRRCLAVSLFVVIACAVGTSTPAWALDPATADHDAELALREGHFGFCKHPPKPLSSHAQSLCALAREIPSCEALVAACEGPKEEPMRLDWLKGALEILARVGVWLLVAAIVLLLAIPIAQGLLRARRDKRVADAKPIPAGDAKPDAAAAEEPSALADAERLLRHADALAAQGNRDRALFTLLQASLRALDDRGAIRIERHRTHGEYVRACRDANAKPTLRALVRDVDVVRFGGGRPDDEGLARSRARAVSLVRALPMALLAVSIAALFGCSSVQQIVRGADPSEDGLFRDLLKRQGAQISNLSTSLATLKYRAPGDVPFAVVVDAERVPLSDETRAHLAQWVDKGGVLVLAGEPGSWPKEMGAKAIKASSRDVRAFQTFHSERRGKRTSVDDDDEDEALVVDEPAVLARPSALEWPSGAGEEVGRFEDGKSYALVWKHGDGKVLAIANDDLLTNAGLARPGNPRALVRLLANLHVDKFDVARIEDGIVPPTSPLGALIEAGLGKALAHSPFAILVLFAAVGLRLGRPKRTPPPARRAFAEHVEATGAMYARTKVASHALHTYARYADNHLRALMPRGTSDVPAFVAARANLPLEDCARIWKRAMEAAPDRVATGDELSVLKELSRMVSIASRRD